MENILCFLKKKNPNPTLFFAFCKNYTWSEPVDTVKCWIYLSRSAYVHWRLWQEQKFMLPSPINQENFQHSSERFYTSYEWRADFLDLHVQKQQHNHIWKLIFVPVSLWYVDFSQVTILQHQRQGCCTAYISQMRHINWLLVRLGRPKCNSSEQTDHPIDFQVLPLGSRSHRHFYLRFFIVYGPCATGSLVLCCVLLISKYG